MCKSVATSLTVAVAVLWCRQKPELEGRSETTAAELANNLSLCVGLGVRG